ncbi:MAG: hypothetical protein IKQ69_07130 [Oscillospiraceae bacterium]|nr:hypothetical protein [Oscillospiraceae bacterium]
MESKRTGVLYRYGGALLSFFVPVALFFVLSLRDGVLANVVSDGLCYLSVADRFLTRGHFIQHAIRPEGFVVPFGLPLILTVFRALGMSVEAIVVFQHFLMGGTCLLLYLTEKNRFGRGGFAPAVLCLAWLRLRMIPDNLYVECYFLFFLCLILWLLSRDDIPMKKKLIWLNVAGFCAFVIRPVLLVVWLSILGYTVFCIRKKQFPLRTALILWGVFALLLLGNAAVNCRETGHWIWLENYSGRELFLANNPSTRPVSFSSSLLEEFGGSRYTEIYRDKSLDWTEKNAVFAAAAREWVLANPGVFIKNTAIKFVRMFFISWRGGTLFALAGAVIEIRGAGPCRRRMLWELGVCLLLALITSIGLVMGRYTLPIWPLASLHLAALAHAVLERLFARG